MKRFTKLLAIAAIGAVITIGMAGCNMDADDGYTFEFKVENYRSTLMGTATQIEFINGSSSSSPVLKTIAINVPAGELSGKYSVSGFTEKHGDDKHIYGVRVTYEDGDSRFDWGSAERGKKVLVYLNSFVGLIFRNGNW